MKRIIRMFSALLAVILCVSLASCTQKKTVMINFEGMAKEHVEQWMSEHKLSTSKIVYSYAYHETMTQNTVISQTPAAGEEIKEGNVSFVLSNGPDPDAEITVIDFKGMKLEEIQQWFINEHFSRVNIEFVYDPGITEGQYVGSSIKDGKARRSDQVTIRISANAEDAGVAVKVPDMSGWTRGQVEEWANTNKITVTYSEVISAKVPKGNVISVDPAPGKDVFRKDGLKVTISKGTQVAAIDLTKKTAAEIEAWGKENGIQISWIQCYSEYSKDKIYRNEPNTGTMKTGDIMKVYISVGSVPIENFTGKSYQTALIPWLNKINANYSGTANLKVTVTEKEVTDKESGIVLEQKPLAGTVNPGSTIAIVIAKHVDPEPEPEPEPDPEPELIEIPRMTGFSEFDFKHALHAYGVIEGKRTEQYSSIIAKDYIIQNDSGKFEPDTPIDYTVSLGVFEIDSDEWENRPYDELSAYIESANRLGANVILDPTYIDTGDESKDGLIIMLEGPLDDGSIHVRVMRYMENTDEDPADTDPDPEPEPAEDDDETTPEVEPEPEPDAEPSQEPETEEEPSEEEETPEDDGTAFFRRLGRILLFRRVQTNIQRC